MATGPSAQRTSRTTGVAKIALATPTTRIDPTMDRPEVFGLTEDRGGHSYAEHAKRRSATPATAGCSQRSARITPRSKDATP